MAKPQITVLMPVYNAAPFLSQAIDSILNQTFENFEFLIIDDGSTDGSLDIIRSYTDSRIRLVEHKKNQGLIATLNEGIKLAEAPLIARMDADDISLPTRLEKQLKSLTENKDVVAVGSDATAISTDNRPLYEQITLPSHEAIQRILAVACPFVHGSVVFRKDAVLQIGGYRAEAYLVEDYDLWARLAKVGKLANIKESLYQWRYNPTGESLSKSQKQKRALREVSDRVWAEFPAEGPAPRSVWAKIWTKKLISAEPIADHRRQLAHFHIYFARGYFQRRQWWLGKQHLLAAWAMAPTVWPFYYYYLTLPFFSEQKMESLELNLIRLYATLKRW